MNDEIKSKYKEFMKLIDEERYFSITFELEKTDNGYSTVWKFYGTPKDESGYEVYGFTGTGSDAEDALDDWKNIAGIDL